MSDIAIKVEQLYKQYRLGMVTTGTISHDLNRWWHKIQGKEDPYQLVTSVNDRTQKGSSEYVWALNNINFEVNKGEVLGIIGKNGAGKSTLLKILSKVTAPTKGNIKVKGRIASLLEVGTGFHPELSGRENIFLNGAILGMTKFEIKRKFDEIVEFSGVDKYIDTPVKRYSSGMYVRLAFAVAAHLESEILIVDEVLAVGDAEFQKKCLGKMKDVSQGEGRTVLFVSHNMSAVRALCDKGIILKQGMTVFSGLTEDAVTSYQKTDSQNGISLIERTDREGNGKVILSDINFKNNKGENVEEIFGGEYLKIEFNLLEKQKSDFSRMIIACSFTDPHQRKILTWVSDEMPNTFYSTMPHKFSLEIPNLNLRPGIYDFDVQISFETTAQSDITDSINAAAQFVVSNTNFFDEDKIIRPMHAALQNAYFTV